MTATATAPPPPRRRPVFGSLAGSTPRRSPSSITAVRMLDGLAQNLARQGRRLVIAHDIGQVRDLLTEGASALGVHPTIDEAMAAARAGVPGGES
jgi:hypothetical protein